MKELIRTLLFFGFVICGISGPFVFIQADVRTLLVFFIVFLSLGFGYVVLYLISEYPVWVGLMIVCVIIGVTFSIEWISMVTDNTSFLSQQAIEMNDYFHQLIPLGIGFIWVMMIAMSHVLWKQLTKSIHHRFRRGICYVVGATMASLSLELLLAPMILNIKRYEWLQGGDFIYGVVSYTVYITWAIVILLLHTFILIFVVLSDNWHRRLEWKSRHQLLLLDLVFSLYALGLGLFAKMYLASFVFIVFNGLFTLVYYLSKKKQKKD